MNKEDRDDIYEANLLYEYRVSDAWGINFRRVEVYDGENPYIIFSGNYEEKRIDISQKVVDKISNTIDKKYIDRNHNFGFANMLDGYINSFVIRKDGCHYPLIINNLYYLTDSKTEDTNMILDIVKIVHKILKKEGVKESYLDLSM